MTKDEKTTTIVRVELFKRDIQELELTRHGEQWIVEREDWGWSPRELASGLESLVDYNATLP